MLQPQRSPSRLLLKPPLPNAVPPCAHPIPCSHLTPLVAHLLSLLPFLVFLSYHRHSHLFSMAVPSDLADALPYASWSRSFVCCSFVVVAFIPARPLSPCLSVLSTQVLRSRALMCACLCASTHAYQCLPCRSLSSFFCDGCRVSATAPTSHRSHCVRIGRIVCVVIYSLHPKLRLR